LVVLGRLSYARADGATIHAVIPDAAIPEETSEPSRPWQAQALILATRTETALETATPQLTEFLRRLLCSGGTCLGKPTLRDTAAQLVRNASDLLPYRAPNRS
jgi:acyl transferase domain-containing protein